MRNSGFTDTWSLSEIHSESCATFQEVCYSVLPFWEASARDGSASTYKRRMTLAAVSRMLQAVSLLASVTALLWVAYVVWVMEFMSRYLHSLTIPLWPTPMSIEAETTERVTTKGRIPAVPPMRSDERVLLTVSSHVAEYVSNLHTSLREQLTARTADNELTMSSHVAQYVSNLHTSPREQLTGRMADNELTMSSHVAQYVSNLHTSPREQLTARMADNELTVSSHVSQYVSNLHTSPREQLTARMADNELTVSSHVAQYVSNLHTSPREQLMARMARVDSVLTCRTVRLQLAYQPQGAVDGSHGKSWQCPHMSHSTSPTCIPAPGNSWRLAWLTTSWQCPHMSHSTSPTCIPAPGSSWWLAWQELTVSSHVAQYVSNLHTSPREQLMARMARVDSVLTCRTVRLQLAYQPQGTVDGSHGKSWQCPHMSHSTSPTCIPAPGNSWRLAWQELTVSSHVAQYVSNLHTSPREQLMARMARVDSVLTCRTVRLQLAYQPQGTVDGSHGKSWQCPHMSHSTSPTCIPAPGSS